MPTGRKVYVKYMATNEAVITLDRFFGDHPIKVSREAHSTHAESVTILDGGNNPVATVTFDGESQELVVTAATGIRINQESQLSTIAGESAVGLPENVPTLPGLPEGVSLEYTVGESQPVEEVSTENETPEVGV